MSDEKFYRIPQPIHPFVNPLPTPATSPNDPESQICVMFSRNWLPFVLGVIKLFQYDDLWENPTEQLKNDGQTLIRQFMTPFLCETGASNVDIQAVDLGGGCQQYQWRIDGGVWMNIGVPVCSGQDGAPGEQGIPGEPGAPGEDCDCGTVPPQPPVVEGDDRCQQACNIAMGLGLYLHQMYADSLAVLKASLEATGIIADAVSDLIDAIPVIGAVINTVVDYATGVVALDVTRLQGANTNAFKEQIQCELYRIMADDTGDFTLDYFEQVKDELSSWGLLLPPQGPLLVLVGQAFALFLETMPAAEFLRRANVYKDSESNCELCEVECGCECTDFGITFDNEAEMYTIVQGSLNAFGFAGQSVLAPVTLLGGDAKEWRAIVDVPTSIDCPVGEVSAMIWNEVYSPPADPIPFPFIAQAWFDGVMVAEVSSLEVHTNGTWQNIHLTFPPDTFADKVRFIAWNDTNTPGRGIDVFIDNLEINYC